MCDPRLRSKTGKFIFVVFFELKNTNLSYLAGSRQKITKITPKTSESQENRDFLSNLTLSAGLNRIPGVIHRAVTRYVPFRSGFRSTSDFRINGDSYNNTPLVRNRGKSRGGYYCNCPKISPKKFRLRRYNVVFLGQLQ